MLFRSCIIYSFFNAKICINANPLDVKNLFASENIITEQVDTLKNLQHSETRISSDVIISSVEVISNSDVLICFSAPVNAQKAVFLSVDMDNPVISFNQISDDKIILSFFKQFIENEYHTFSYITIYDLEEKSLWGFHSFWVGSLTLSDDSLFGTLVFSEIMANPINASGLPEVEYVEIYNRSDAIVNLKGYKYYYNYKGYEFPDISISPNEYIAFCNKSKLSLFDSNINIYGITSFPVMNNTGKLIYLENGSGDLIHFAEYTDKWYNDKNKSSGGFSLEVIDVENIYPSSKNWCASTDTSGGTPGRCNSVSYENPDNTRAYLISHHVDKEGNVQVVFSKNLDEQTLNRQQYLDQTPYFKDIYLGEYPLSNKVFAVKDLKEIYREESYLFSFDMDGLKCISGNEIYNPGELEFGDTQIPEDGDVRISEILFNASDPSLQFIEVYNNSNKYIDLRDLYVSVPNKNDVIETIYQLSTIPTLFEPSKYLLICRSPEAVFEKFGYKGIPRIVVPSKFPTLNAKNGKLAFTDSKKNIIEDFDYSESLHTAKDKSLVDLSLERISFSVPAVLASNWCSGKEDECFVSPGYANQVSGTVASFDTLKLAREYFSFLYPYMKIASGHPQSVLTLNYLIDESESIIDMSVYNSKGIEIARPYIGFEIGAAGTLFIDLAQVTEKRIIPGIYIIYIKCRNRSGVIEKKMVCPFVP